MAIVTATDTVVVVAAAMVAVRVLSRRIVLNRCHVQEGHDLVLRDRFQCLVVNLWSRLIRCHGDDDHGAVGHFEVGQLVVLGQDVLGRKPIPVIPAVIDFGHGLPRGMVRI